ncbi:hypothetical protein PG993_007047 [Apiospora rasikravindrae]|uniref:RING-type domain-containing protein n=1 Tax=Apiospora rasikravindrae TaxID=990691 RepID=A0ABR1SWD8_9PEZI
MANNTNNNDSFSNMEWTDEVNRLLEDILAAFEQQSRSTPASPAEPSPEVPLLEDCPICKVETASPQTDFVTLPCDGAHRACPDCIRQWLESDSGAHDKCPFCRQELTHSCGHLLSVDLLVAGTTIPKDVLQSPCEADCPGLEEEDEYEDDEMEQIYIHSINHFYHHFAQAMVSAGRDRFDYAHRWLSNEVDFDDLIMLTEDLMNRVQRLQNTLHRWLREDMDTIAVRLGHARDETALISATNDPHVAERVRFPRGWWASMPDEYYRAMFEEWEEALGTEEDNYRRLSELGGYDIVQNERIEQAENRFNHFNERMRIYVGRLQSWTRMLLEEEGVREDHHYDLEWWRAQIGDVDRFPGTLDQWEIDMQHEERRRRTRSSLSTLEMHRAFWVRRHMSLLSHAMRGVASTESEDNMSIATQNGDAEGEEEPNVDDDHDDAAASDYNRPEDAHSNNAYDDAPASPQQINHNWNGPGFWEAQPADDDNNDNAEPAEDWSDAVAVAGAENHDDNPDNDAPEDGDDQAAVEQQLPEPEQQDQPDEEDDLKSVVEDACRMAIDFPRADLPDATIPQPPAAAAAPEPRHDPFKPVRGLIVLAAGALALVRASAAEATPQVQSDIPLDPAPAALPEIEAVEEEGEPQAEEEAKDEDKNDKEGTVATTESEQRAARWTAEMMSAEMERLERRRRGPKL